MTLLETLVHPFKHGDTNLAQRYRDMLLHTKGLTTVMLSEEISEEAAELRALYSIRTPDAIQMATAIKASVPFFLTKDTRLPSLLQLQVLVLNELRSS